MRYLIRLALVLMLLAVGCSGGRNVFAEAHDHLWGISQNYIISGYVFRGDADGDKVEGVPITLLRATDARNASGRVVYVPIEGLPEVTDDNGHYQFDNVEVGDYIVTVPWGDEMQVALTETDTREMDVNFILVYQD